jgi:hypothetical protein
MNTLELSVNQCEEFLKTGLTSTLVSDRSVLKVGDLITVCDRQCVVRAVRDEPHSDMKRIWLKRR